MTVPEGQRILVRENGPYRVYGPVKLVDVNGNSADVRLTGMCARCPSALMALHVGVELALPEEITECETLRLL